MAVWYNIIREELAGLRGGSMGGLHDRSVHRRRSVISLDGLVKSLSKEE